MFEDLDDDDIDEEDMEEFQKAMDMPALPPWMTTHRPGAQQSVTALSARVVEEPSASASKPGHPSPALQKEEAPEVAEDSDDDPLYDLD